MEKRKRLNLTIAIVAVLVLSGSFAALAYTLIRESDTNEIVVNGVGFVWEDMFNSYGVVSFAADGQSFEGIRLGEILNDTGLSDPISHQYRITGSDGYQKDVSWQNVVDGYLVEDGKRTVFPGLTKSFWVRNVVTIEVL